MDEKKWEMYLDEVLSFVKFKYDHRAIRRELVEHMADLKEDLMAEGMDEEAAEYMTIAHMGDAAEIGQELDKEHHALLGWIWRISRVVMIYLLFVTFLPAISIAEDMISGYFQEYEIREDAELLWEKKIEREYQLYDDTLILHDLYYYDDEMLEMSYRTKRSPLKRSINWSLSVSMDAYDAAGNELSLNGGGFANGGYNALGAMHLDGMPADAKMLEISCEELVIKIDLETGEVMDNAEA